VPHPIVICPRQCLADDYRYHQRAGAQDSGKHVGRARRKNIARDMPYAQGQGKQKRGGHESGKHICCKQALIWFVI